MAKTAVIVVGGRQNVDFMEHIFKQDVFDLQIAADRGLEFFAKTNRMPTHIVGDFDSVSSEVLKRFEGNDAVAITRVPSEKDDTDTELAISIAIEEGATDILLLAATGTRLDHTISSINCMAKMLEQGIRCCLLDEYNAISLVNREYSIARESQYGDFVSLIPYTDRVEGLTLSGFKYPLTDAVMTKDNSLGISNEIMDEIGTIQVKNGVLIVIESRD